MIFVMKNIFPFLILLVFAQKTFCQLSGPILDNGFARFEQNDFEGAISDFNKVIEMDTKDYPGSIQMINAYTYKGESLFMLNKYQDAIASLKEAINLGGTEYISAYFFLGRSNLELKNYSESIREFDKTIEIDNQYQSAYYFRGIARSRAGDKNGACKDLSIAKTLGNPDAQKIISELCK
jgi:tetratricopeptide (TPR) repeat protein